VLEQNVKITQSLLDELGNNFEKTKNGFTDYSLIDDSGRVVCVVEAKAERLHPLVGKNGAFVLASVWLYQLIFWCNHQAHKPLTIIKEQVDLARWRVPI